MVRFFEVLPGALAWGTIILLVGGARFVPQTVGVFVVLFDVYWLLKSVYLSIHMRVTFKTMQANLRMNWIEKLDSLPLPAFHSSLTRWSDVHHLIIFPMCREPYEVVRESFASLSCTEYPKDCLYVVLATEAGAGPEAVRTARRIEEEFGSRFGKFLCTVHPANLPGEISGKGSNIAWAACEAVSRFQLSSIGSRVLVSAFDIDTHTPPHYFARLTYMFLTSPDPIRAIYQPVPLFTNNIYETPLLARIVAFSATFWQMMQQARPERLTTFSSQSIPLPVLLDVGFWQRDVVSEDSRIFWQAYLHYQGNFRVEPLLYPVTMDANVAPTFWGTMRNVYLQQRRWGWGVENVPYVFEGFRRDSLIPRAKKRYWVTHLLEGFHSWATNILILFFLGWLPAFLGGSAFRATLFSYSIPGVTRGLMLAAMFGVLTSVEVAFALLPPRPAWFGHRHFVVYVLEWLLLPLTLFAFGTLPGLEAQTRLMLGNRWRLGFWVTPKTRATSR